ISERVLKELDCIQIKIKDKDQSLRHL
ncbi:uncharacterized protein METZ01_LOCUS282585, partial [marine metagenome]